MLEPARQGGTGPRAFLKIGPKTLAQQQLALALALECQRVICIARGMSPDLITLQHETERAGARFHSVSGTQGLGGLVTASDDLLVIADGLLVMPQAAIDLVSATNTVLVQPVEAGTAAGFERIDLNHASAGMMRIPGRLVEKLSQLPPDCDIVSSLTRIALQSGVPQQQLPPELRDGVRWTIIRDEAEAHATETGWIALHMGGHRAASPTAMIARLAVKAFGPAILHAGTGARAVSLAAAAIGLAALGAGILGFTATGLVICALAWIVHVSGEKLHRVERTSLARQDSGWPREATFNWLLDGVTIAIVSSSPDYFPVIPSWQRVLAPIALICLVRLLPRLIEPRLAAWLGDHAVLPLVLAAAAAGGLLNPIVALLVAALALLAVVWPNAHRG